MDFDPTPMDLAAVNSDLAPIRAALGHRGGLAEGARFFGVRAKKAIAGPGPLAISNQCFFLLARVRCGLAFFLLSYGCRIK
jgi:hypothetical protein